MLRVRRAVRAGLDMSPRPRETSDEEIVAATARVMQRRSPAQLTLAEVAKEAGVVPATLIQRFGTKRGLLLAVCGTAPNAAPAQFAEARKRFRSPLATLVELMTECTSFASTPEAMANGLAYLQVDLTDPDFHAITLALSRAIREEIRKLLAETVAARELKPCDDQRLAHLVHVTYGGSMLDWAIYRQGSVADWVRRDLLTLLNPYLTSKGRVELRKTVRSRDTSSRKRSNRGRPR
jgi:AcrR family transcriptional regulator